MIPAVLRIRPLFFLPFCNRYAFFIFAQTKFVYHFITCFKHLVTLKIKEQKINLPKLYFRQYYLTRKMDLQGPVWGLKDPDPGDPKRPDPQHWISVML